MYNLVFLLLIVFMCSCSKEKLPKEPQYKDVELKEDFLASFSFGNTSIEYLKGEKHLKYLVGDRRRGLFTLDETSTPYLIRNSITPEGKIIMTCNSLNYDVFINSIKKETANIISYDVVYSDGTLGGQHRLITKEDLDVETFRNYIGHASFDLGAQLDNLTHVSNARCGGLCIGLGVALAVAVIGNYCNNLVEQGTQNCSTGCYTVSACSVDCHACD